MHRKNILFLVIILLLFYSVSWAFPPAIPYRIAGTIVVNGELIAYDNDALYTVAITRDDMSSFPEDVVECNECEIGDSYKDGDPFVDRDRYMITLERYDEESHPGGVMPGDVVIIHLYNQCSELIIISPEEGRIVIDDNDMREINIEAVSIPGPPMYSQDQLNEAVEAERKKWDMKNDNKIGLEEAIRALQVVSGCRNNISP